MIKYLELTAPESNEFRQVKITSIEVAEGDTVEIGDTLFRVKSGDNEIDLPSTRAGKICELIVLEGENISVMTPLLLLETEVAGSTATPHISASQEPASSKAIAAEQPVKKTKAKKKKTKKKQKKTQSNESVQAKPLKAGLSQAKINDQQQSLDLVGEHAEKAKRALSQASGNSLSGDSEHKTAQGSDKQPVSNTSESTTTKAENIMSSDTQTNKIPVPDIGGDSAKVIEIHVKVGDSVAVDDSIITLESDKASMDVPSPQAGVVASIIAQLDQEMSEGDPILELTLDEDKADDSQPAAADKEPAAADKESAAADKEPATADKEPAESDSSTPQAKDTPADTATTSVEVSIPDIGGDSAKVIEILVKVGQQVKVEDPLVTLESDKASMDVPSSAAGIIESIELSLDQDVSEGMVVVKLSSVADESSAVAQDASPASSQDTKTTAKKPEPAKDLAAATSDTPSTPAGKSHASPSIRRFARELGVDLSTLKGSGRKGRVNKADVTQYVKSVISGAGSSSPAAQAGSGGGIPQIPAVDFSKFGEIEIQPLNRIKKLTARNLHRSWLNVPHVTHNDESNINDLEEFRKQLNSEYAKQKKDIKLSPLAFIVKAVVNALQTYPQFNSSLDPDGENLILKKYVNIGIAVETPNGLVVPVVKDADKLSVGEIATAMGELAAKARDKKLTTRDMSGAGFTISSLGGIGGTGFTPIVNAPEVAILGVSRSKISPVWDGSKFQPGTMLPLSLSYDHRVIDGAEAARFTRHIAAVLEDVRRLAV